MATHLLRAVCTVAMLAAVPAFAQTESKPADTGAGGAPNTPTAHETMPSSSMPAKGASTKMSHRSTMAHHTMAVGSTGKPPMSTDPAVDKLNEQSYQAAQQGQGFNAPGAMPSSTPAPSPKKM